METPKLLRDILDTAADQGRSTIERSKAHAYYDSHQSTDETRQLRDEIDMPSELDINLSKEVINTVLGHEHKARVSWQNIADDDDSTEIAEAMNVKLNETMRMVDANTKCSDAYKPMIIGGEGWVYFGKNTDPLGYKHKCESVPWQEMIYDRRSKCPILSDARWEARRRFMDEDAAMALLPEHEKLIKETFSNWDQWDITPGGMHEERSYDNYYGNTHPDQLYMNTNGLHQVAIYDVYYRKWDKRNLIHFPNGLVTLFDGDDPDHLSAILNRTAYQTRERVPVMHNAWFVGSECVDDEVSPHPHNEFPYIPFTGYVEDDSNDHYGLMRDIIPTQDVYNSATARIMHIMNSKRIQYEKGAFNGTKNEHIDDVMDEVLRRDGALEVAFGHSDKVKIESEWAELERLMVIKETARNEMRSVSGVSNAYSGINEGKQSGVALATLAEMASASLAEINAHYQVSRQCLGRIVMAHLVEEIGSEETEVNIPSQQGGHSKSITLNKVDPEEGVSNALTRARTSVVLADVETSEGYRQQNHMKLQDMYKESPEDLQRTLLPYVIHSSNLPEREEVLAEINRAAGRAPTEEERAAQHNQQMEAQAAAAKLAQQKEQAEVRKELAQAKKLEAEAAQILNEIGQSRTGQINEEGEAANEAQATKKAQIHQLRELQAKRELESA